MVEAVGQLPHPDPRAAQLMAQGIVATALGGEGPQVAGQRGHGPRICLAMISFMISEVPPPMVISRMSRKNRSIGYSRM